MNRPLVEWFRNGGECAERGEECRVRDAASGCTCTAAADTITALTARVEELEGSLRDLLRLVDEDQEEDAPPYLVDQVLDRARAAITKGERE